MTNSPELDAHSAGTMALMSVAKAALGALRVAVDDLKSDAKTATRAVSEQATLLSKAVDSLSKKIDSLPDAQRARMETTTPPVDPRLIRDITDALGRFQRLTLGQTCPDCGLVLPANVETSQGL